MVHVKLRVCTIFLFKLFMLMYFLENQRFVSAFEDHCYNSTYSVPFLPPKLEVLGDLIIIILHDIGFSILYNNLRKYL